MRGHRFDLFCKDILLSDKGFRLIYQYSFIYKRNRTRALGSMFLTKTRPGHAGMPSSSLQDKLTGGFSLEPMIVAQNPQCRVTFQLSLVGLMCVKSKTSLVSAAFFEIFIKEMKCIGTSWAEIAFDHQVFDELSLLVYCF